MKSTFQFIYEYFKTIKNRRSWYSGSIVEGQDRLGLREYKDDLREYDKEGKITGEQMAPGAWLISIVGGIFIGLLIRDYIFHTSNIDFLILGAFFIWWGWRLTKYGIIECKDEEIKYWKFHFVRYFDETQSELNSNK